MADAVQRDKRSSTSGTATTGFSCSLTRLLQILVPLCVVSVSSSFVLFQSWQRSAGDPATTSYLWSSPRPDGFNNQLISLYSAINCAIRLNRTLVLPHMYENVRYDAKRQGPFPFSDYFNTSGIARIVNVTTPVDLLRQLYRPCRRIVYKERKVPLVLDYYRTSLYIPLTHVDDIANTEDEACIDDSLCNGALDQALGPYSAYEVSGQGFDLKSSSEFLRIRSALQPQRNIFRLATTWQRQINSSFNAVHIRRGDYERKCTSMKKECARFGRDAFFQSATRLRQAVTQFNRSGLPLFVSTTHNDECREILKDSGVKLWFTSDLVVPDDLAWAKKRVDIMALASQVLASRGEQFLGNRFSSFTSEVNNMRQLRNLSTPLLFF